MDRKQHWEHIYGTKPREQVSWFREHLDTSLQIISATGVSKAAAIIDVGGRNSNLVDDLLDSGFVDVSVLDISGKAITDSQARLGRRGALVHWIESDITQAALPVHRFDVWHDRAVFHFLTEPEDRRRYVRQVIRSLKEDGHVIVASFGAEGPEKYSGLAVVRYSPESMHEEFGNSFSLVDHVEETHHTPFGTTQAFVYCYCRKIGN